MNRPPVSGEPPGEWEPDDELAALPVDRPPVSGEPHRDYAGRTCSTGLMHDHSRPSGEPRGLWADLEAESRKPGPTMTITKAQYNALVWDRRLRAASTGAALDVETLVRVFHVLAAEDTGMSESDYEDEDFDYWRERAARIAAEYARLAEQEGEPHG